MTGLSAATALGAPIGRAIGSLTGNWRATMLFVSALGVLAAAGTTLLLPADLSAATTAPRPPRRACSAGFPRPRSSRPADGRPRVAQRARGGLGCEEREQRSVTW